jgi:proline iminopeptidase
VSYTVHGNENGTPILAFHGGPGSRSRPEYAKRYDLSAYKVILFDQRGCGKSTPLGSLEHNTTEDILVDAERIREALGVDAWFVSGASWGATLSLLYAIKHTDRVRGLLIASVFIADHDSMRWSMTDPHGVARLMPDVWAKRMQFFDRFDIRVETQNEDLLKAFEGTDLSTQQELAAGIQNWEGNLFSIQSDTAYRDASAMTDIDIAGAKIFVYYESNHEFLPDRYILDNVSKIASIPCVIVHGRYDIICTIDKAYELSQQMRDCELIIAPASGHKLTPEGFTIQWLAYREFLWKHAS